MRRTGWLAAGAVVFVLGTSVRAADVNADLAALSAYAWRGQVVNDEPVIQPALNVVSGGFGLNAWGNFNTTDRVTDDPDFSEIDLTVSYGGRLGAVGYGLGLIEYVFPNSELPGTREAYLSLGLPDAPVVPALSVYRDLDEADGFYVSFGLSKSFPLTDKATLALGASLGAGDDDYNAFYFGVDDAALNDANAGASVSFAVTDRITLTPGLQYTWLPDSDIRNGADNLYKDSEQLVGSVKLTIVF